MLARQLFEAARDGRTAEVEGLLSVTVDVNWRKWSMKGWTALHTASHHGHEGIVSLLLRHPDIDPNINDYSRNTPFMMACLSGMAAAARRLLQDPRVDPNERDLFGFTPLYLAAYRGHLDLVRWCVASGRALDLGETGNPRTDAIAAARSREIGEVWDEVYFSPGRRTQCSEIATLLEEFRQDPSKARLDTWRKLGCCEELAADLFALVVFFCEELLQPPQDSQKSWMVSSTIRFFAVAAQLPMELQMMLCHCAIGSPKTNITVKSSEIAFRSLCAKIALTPGIPMERWL